DTPMGAFQKLRCGHPISVLIVGDSIGKSSGASDGHSWEALLDKWLYEKYAVRCSFKNISLGGTGSYTGYVQTMKEDDDADYDLAIICYGHNDGLEDLSVYYEAIIRAIRSKFIHCNMITVLQSSQKTYTDKIKAIQDLSAHYDIPAADTIEAFEKSEMSYDELTTDGVHPNDAGYELYFDAISRVIEEQTAAYTPHIVNEISALNADMDRFERFYYIPSDAGRRSSDGCIIEIPFASPLSGAPGMEFERKGEGKVSVYIDDKLLCSEEMGWSDEGSLYLVSPLSKEAVTVEKNIRLEFTSEDAADRFYGLAFTDVR
nr:SGNH/GDSL hydrolase family protein [Lachnospiraceae bacterium]